jgi:transcriptional regulator with XRE-family HTH domain
VCTIPPIVKEEPVIDLRIGSAIRAERERRAISLRELAKRAGLTASGLSQIERGVMHPSLLSLRRIAASLGMPMFWFVVDHQAGDPNIVVRKADRVVYQTAGAHARYEVFTRGVNRELEGTTCTMQPGKRVTTKPAIHLGDELLLVMRGVGEAEVAGVKYHLGAGDTIYIAGGLPHRLTNAGDDELEAIWVISAAAKAEVPAETDPPRPRPARGRPRRNPAGVRPDSADS